MQAVDSAIVPHAHRWYGTVCLSFRHVSLFVRIKWLLEVLVQTFSSPVLHGGVVSLGGVLQRSLVARGHAFLKIPTREGVEMLLRPRTS